MKLLDDYSASLSNVSRLSGLNSYELTTLNNWINKLVKIVNDFNYNHYN